MTFHGTSVQEFGGKELYFELCMFAERLNLPIEPERIAGQDQTLSLAGMTWADYEKLIREEYSGYRVSYLKGVITIVSPSQNHEIIAEVINYLVVAYCREYSLLYFPMRSTTLTNSPLAGKEPDVSFAFGERKSTPDLAIEVVYSSGGIADLEKYKYLGVKEVWFWENNEMSFYQLVDSSYLKIHNSNYLPKLTPVFLVEFVNRGLTESPLTIEADFVKQLDSLD